MRAELGTAAFTKYAGRFVWLSIDVDQPTNQAFLRAHPIEGYPVFFVLDPATDRPLATLLGQADVAAMKSFLERGERAFRAPPRQAADAAAARGDALAGSGKPEQGAAAYGEALRLGGREWPERPRVLNSRLGALQMVGHNEECAEEALHEATALANGRAFAAAVLSGMTCAAGGGDAAWAVEAERAFEPLAQQAQAAADTLDDERYQLYELRIRSCARAHDEAGAHRLADEWLTRIERDDERAVQGPDARLARDVARVRAGTRLGDLSRILPALEATARAQPHSYTVYTRLASTYLAVGRNADARNAIERGLAAGPGTLGRVTLLSLRGDASAKLSDVAGAVRAIDEALADAGKIEAPQVRAAVVARLRKKRDDLQSAGAPSRPRAN